MKKMLTIALTMVILLNTNMVKISASDKAEVQPVQQEEIITQYEVTDFNYNV